MIEHLPSVLTAELPSRALGVLDVAGVLPAIWTADAAQPSFDGGPGRGQGDVPCRFVSGAERRQESTDELDFVALGGGAAARRTARLSVHLPFLVTSRTLFSFRPILAESFLRPRKQSHGVSRRPGARLDSQDKQCAMDRRDIYTFLRSAFFLLRRGMVPSIILRARRTILP